MAGALVALVLVAPLAGFGVEAGAAPGATAGPRPANDSGDGFVTEVDGDAIVTHPAGEPLALTTASPATTGYAVLGGVTGYARSSYVIVLAATPGIERVRTHVELAARNIAMETGLAISVAPGQVADRAPLDGEVVVRVSRESSCGTLSSPGIAGCGGPRTSGSLITRGDVSLAPETGCDNRAVSTVVHELGHAFGLGHYEAQYQGLLQVMYPSTASGAPNFRAGDRAGLRALAHRTVGQHVAEVAPTAVLALTAAPANQSPRADATGDHPARIQAASSAAAYFSQPALARVLDTRTGGPGAFVAGESRTLDLSPYVGSSADAVVLNLTTTGALGDGFVTASPGGAPRPDTSNANYTAGKDSANLVIVRLGPGSTLSLYDGGSTVHLIADLLGVFSAAGDSGYVPTNPSRVYDTRASPVAGERGFPLGCADVDAFFGDPLTAAGVPTSAAAAVVNLTAADANGDGFVSLLDPDDGVPSGPEAATSNLNVSNGATRANLAISPGRQWYIRNSNALVSDVVMDLAGYFVDTGIDPAASAFVATDPNRVLDTRRNVGLTGRFAPAAVRSLPVPVPAGIDPSKVVAVVINMTVAEPDAGGYLTVAPSGAPLPNASNVNYGTGGAVPNLAIVKVGPGTSIDIMAFAGNPHVIGDVMGYFVRA